MGCTKQQLHQKLIRALGGSMMKIELCIEDLNDAINMSRDYYITWAVGNATQEVYFLLMLENGRYVYDLPVGIVEVMKYHDHFGSYGLGGYDGSFCGYNPLWYTGPEQGNTSFFSQGDPFTGSFGGVGGIGNMHQGSSPYTFVDYYASRMYMSMIHNTRANRYLWKYHKSTNQIKIHPTPECGNTISKTVPSGSIYDTPSAAYPCPVDNMKTETYESPGYVLIKANMIEGSSLPTYVPAPSADLQCSMYDNISETTVEWLYSQPWIFQYSLALLKQRLGLIRRKYSNNSSLGGANISLDGDILVSEGREDQQRLEEEIDSKYSYDGYGIYIG